MAVRRRKPPALLEIVRRDREAAWAYVLARQEGATVVEDGCTYSLFDALAIGQAIRKGEARLLGKVIFHRQEMTVCVRWEPLTGEASAELLNRRRECLKNALEGRLAAMENSGWENPQCGGIRPILRPIWAVLQAFGTKE